MAIKHRELRKELTDTQIDICMMLSDESGHSLQNLAEIFLVRKGEVKHKSKKQQIKDQMSNLQPYLKELGQESILGSRNSFRSWEVRDPAGLISKFHDSKDQLSSYIGKRLKEPKYRDRAASEYFPIILHIFLSELLNDPNLFDEKRFGHIDLSESVRDSIRPNLEHSDLHRLNRQLLEEAYPKELLRTRNSIIYSKTRKTTNPDSKHPDQLEFPYYIKKNLRVFDFILSSLVNKINDLWDTRNNESQLKKEKPVLEDELRIEKINYEDLTEAEANEIENDEREFYNNMVKKYVDLNYNFVHSPYTFKLIKIYGFIKICVMIEEIEESRSCVVPLAKMALNEGILKNKEEIDWANYLIN